MDKKENNQYQYQIGEIVETKNGQVKILSQYYTHRTTKSKGKIITQTYRCYDIECQICHGVIEEYTDAKIKSLSKCPYCVGKRIKIGFNDMWTTSPEMAELLKNPEDGYTHTKQSCKKLEWFCPDCGELVIMTPGNVYKQNGRLSCKKCGIGTSYPNRFMFNLLTYLRIDFIPEKTFSWSNGKIYDFYLPKFNIIIEMHGGQHYVHTGFQRTLELEQENDLYKEKLAKENGISKYIVVECMKSLPEYIYQNICNSELRNIIKIDNIDINPIHEQSIKKFIFVVIDALNDNNDDVVKAAQQLKIDPHCVYKYIHIAEERGWYKHNWEAFKKKRFLNTSKTRSEKYGKPFLCVETGYVFKAGSELDNNSEKIFNKNMTRACLNKALKDGIKAYGYHWQYITHSEFNRIKMEFPDKAFGDFFNLSLDETNKEKTA